jgi:hypothetical protein
MYGLGPSGAPAYAAIMDAVGVCSECGEATLQPENGVWLDPRVVDASDPAAMALMFLQRHDGTCAVWAASSMAGQPAHRLHRHQPIDTGLPYGAELAEADA